MTIDEIRAKNKYYAGIIESNNNLNQKPMKEAEVSIIKKEDSVALEVLKKQSEEISLQLKGLVITDETSLHIATGIAANANKFVKAVEDKRKELKEPSITEGKEIDRIAKAISNPVDSGVSDVKSKILIYTKEKEEKAKAAQRAIQVIKDKIEKYKNDTIKAIDACKTDDEIKAVFASSVQKNPEDPNFQNYLVELKAIREQLLEYLKARRTVINSKSVESVAKAEEAIVVAAEIMEEQIEVVAAVEIKAAENTPAKGITKTWKYEIEDFSAVPDSLKMEDSVKINAWKKSLQGLGLLVDGKEYKENGIRYYQEQSVRL